MPQSSFPYPTPILAKNLGVFSLDEIHDVICHYFQAMWSQVTDITDRQMDRHAITRPCYSASGRKKTPAIYIIHSSMNYCECSFTYLVVVLNCVTGSDENYASHCLSTWHISVKKTKFWSLASATQCISCIISSLRVRALKHWHSFAVSIRLLPTRQLFQSSLNTYLLAYYNS